MLCTNCGSKRVVEVNGDCSKQLHIELDGTQRTDLPDDMGIGDGTYISFEYCLDCGQIAGDFPLPTTELELEEALNG